MAAASNQVPLYLIFHYFWTYAITSTRFLKGYWGIDHNVNPREDIDRFGDKAVASGKMTASQLRMLKRNAASHANTIEQLPFFIGSALLATVAKVPNDTVNRGCLIYTVLRMVYHVVYLSLDRPKYTWFRSVIWWAANLDCLWLVWESKKYLV